MELLGGGECPPVQESTRAEQVQSEFRMFSARLLQDGGVQPDPHVAQDQRHAHEQQPQLRVASAGTDAGLFQLSVAAFDAETAAIPLRDLAGRAMYAQAANSNFLRRRAPERRSV